MSSMGRTLLEVLGPGIEVTENSTGGWGFSHTVDILFRQGLHIDVNQRSQWSFTAWAAQFIKGHGMGTMTVDVDKRTVITLPVAIDSLMSFEGDGEAWVGFTAATGWGFQAHEILWWRFWEEWDLNDSPEFVSQVRGGKSFRPATTESPTQVPTQTPTW